MTAYELDHLAFAVPTWGSAGHFLAGRLSGRWLSGFEQPDFHPAQVGFAGDMRLELLEPGGAQHSFIRRFLVRRGAPAPHHITFKVDSIEETLEMAQAAGCRPILVNIDNDIWREAFLHPRDTGLGFLLQVVETALDPAEYGHDVGADLRPAEWPEPGGAPAALPTIVGAVASMSAATTVLGDLLGAEITEMENGAQRYHWSAGADLVLRSMDTNVNGATTGHDAVSGRSTSHGGSPIGTETGRPGVERVIVTDNLYQQAPTSILFDPDHHSDYVEELGVAFTDLRGIPTTRN